jgi:hypothetical protein
LAKNTAHMAACIDVAPNDAVLVNLDGDNIFTSAWLRKLLNFDGPRLVSKELTVVHYHNPMSSGTYGRLAYLKSQWMGVHGYDSEFQPTGCEHTDLKLRLGNGGKVLDTKKHWVGISIPNVPKTGDPEVDQEANNKAPTHACQCQATDTMIHAHTHTCLAYKHAPPGEGGKLRDNRWPGLFPDGGA